MVRFIPPEFYSLIPLVTVAAALFVVRCMQVSRMLDSKRLIKKFKLGKGRVCESNILAVGVIRDGCFVPADIQNPAVTGIVFRGTVRFSIPSSSWPDLVLSIITDGNKMWAMVDRTGNHIESKYVIHTTSHRLTYSDRKIIRGAISRYITGS